MCFSVLVKLLLLLILVIFQIGLLSKVSLHLGKYNMCKKLVVYTQIYPSGWLLSIYIRFFDSSLVLEDNICFLFCFYNFFLYYFGIEEHVAFFIIT